MRSGRVEGRSPRRKKWVQSQSGLRPHAPVPTAHVHRALCVTAPAARVLSPSSLSLSLFLSLSFSPSLPLPFPLSCGFLRCTSFAACCLTKRTPGQEELRALGGSLLPSPPFFSSPSFLLSSPLPPLDPFPPISSPPFPRCPYRNFAKVGDLIIGTPLAKRLFA